MPLKPRLRLLILAVAMMLGVLTVAALVSASRNSDTGQFNPLDTAYQFRFSKISQGTNHVVFRGNFWLARLKHALYQSPLRPICRFLWTPGTGAHWYAASTPTNATVLWVGWTHMDFTNGTPPTSLPPFPEGPFSVLACFLSEPDGHTTRLPFCTSVIYPSTKEIMGAWLIPGQVTNLAGCTVYLREYGKQADVASMQLRPTPAVPNTGKLTAAQAGALARTLANKQAQTLCGIQPFRDGRPAEFIHGCWAWHDRRGWGRGDIEATVKFAADGSNPSVSVRPMLEVYD